MVGEAAAPVPAPRQPKPAPRNVSILKGSSDEGDETTQDPSPVYGHIVILGYNGKNAASATYQGVSQFTLQRRDVANGIKPHTRHDVERGEQHELFSDNSRYSIAYTLTKQRAVVVEYVADEETEMFQFGRSDSHTIDFQVQDTLPSAQSTVSRYACRITVGRSPPYTARIFAAGFNEKRNMFLGEETKKWKRDDGLPDGLTTNGVFISRSRTGVFSGEPSSWYEVSVCGAMFPCRERRAVPHTGDRVSDDNTLTDGTLIDLCGVTLLWRTHDSLQASCRSVEPLIVAVNSLKMECPVLLQTLHFSRNGKVRQSASQPYAYLSCGHVYSNPNWETSRVCSLCKVEGPVVPLKVGLEPAFYCDSSSVSYCFKPCGHATTEATVRFWAAYSIPQGASGFSPVCPFCATPLLPESPFLKLFYQFNEVEVGYPSQLGDVLET